MSRELSLTVCSLTFPGLGECDFPKKYKHLTRALLNKEHNSHFNVSPGTSGVLGKLR